MIWMLSLVMLLWSAFPAEAYHKCFEVSNTQLHLERRIGPYNRYRWSLHVFNKCDEPHHGVVSIQVFGLGTSLAHTHTAIMLAPKEAIDIGDSINVPMTDPRTKGRVLASKLRLEAFAETYHRTP